MDYVYQVSVTSGDAGDDVEGYTPLVAIAAVSFGVGFTIGATATAAYLVGYSNGVADTKAAGATAAPSGR